MAASARDDFFENPAIAGKHMTKAMSIGAHTGSGSIDLPVTLLRNLFCSCVIFIESSYHSVFHHENTETTFAIFKNQLTFVK